MKKTILTLCLLAFTGLCFAPINLHERPSNGVRYQEATNADLNHQQVTNGAIKEVGSTPSNTTSSGSTVDADPTDHAASNAMQQAEAAREQMSANLQIKGAMQLRKDAGSSPWRFAFYAAIVGAMGYGVIFGLQRWTDKNAPEMRAKRPGRLG